MRHLSIVVGIAVLALGVLRAQPPTSTQPGFRSGTTLVEVSAVVTRDGRPVTDLRPEEVTVLDNGKPQPLAAFEWVDLGRGERPAQRRDFVLVLDDWHIQPSNTALAAGAALAFIDAVGPHDRLAVVNTGPFEIALDPTTEREPARALVRTFRGQGTGAGTSPMEIDLRLRRAMEVLRHVASAVRSDAAERRAVLLISEGHRSFVQELNNGVSPAGQAAFTEYLQVLREAALGNVAFYTVDPRGLRAPSGAQVASRDIPLSLPGPGSASTSPPFVVENEAFGSLALLARNTGGIQTLWTNELTTIVPQLLQDSRQYYRLAYAQPDPPPGKKQPPSRSIEVKVARKGVDVRARQRYVPAPVS